MDDRIECPRCGYDMRGVVATWQDECPVEGTCAECGLVFDWGEVLNPRLSLPRWFVESRERRSLRPGQIASTFFRSFWPWSFWSKIRMTHPRRWARAAAYGVALIVVLYVVLAVATGIMAWQEHRYVVRRGATMSVGGAEATLRAMALPFSGLSPGGYTYPGFGGGRFPGVLSPPRSSAWAALVPVLPPLAYALAVQLICGVAHVLLPVTRRRAKVRWAHIGRVTFYGIPLILPALALTLITTATHDMMLGPLLLTLAVLLWLALIPMALIWWSVAIGRYLRMPHAWGVGLALLIIGLLTPISLFSLIMSLFSF